MIKRKIEIKIKPITELDINILNDAIKKTYYRYSDRKRILENHKSHVKNKGSRISIKQREREIEHCDKVCILFDLLIARIGENFDVE